MGIVLSLGLLTAAAVGSGPTYPPFDLSDLPAVGPQGLAGFRPAALAGGAATWGQVGDPRFLAMALGGAVEINPSAPGPAPAEVAECVVGLRLTASLERTKPNEDGRDKLFKFLLHAHTGVVRTAGPFDWAGRLRKWFPNAEPKTHAGRAYLAVPIRGDNVTATIAFFCPDDRTLAFGGEDDIKGVIDRRKDNKPGPTPPAGWDAVARAAVGIAAVADDQPWLTVGPGFPSSAPLDDARDFSKSVARATLAVSPPGRVRLTFAAKDAAAARIAEACLTRLLDRLRGVLAETLPGRPPVRFAVAADGLAVRVEAPLPTGLGRLFDAPEVDAR